ncbi:Hypothetical_protein [Hexamita inflata]|uniref:Hypothetical_protein n=1 Tax=Hexamita inflata TaxID=28002 RepID=A0AA86NL49_9EUKA|nr:Hypothetical protein HINF_LOCUS9852 [Hexamita inflata]
MFLLLIIAGYFPAQKPEISKYLQTPSKTYTFSQQNWEMLSLKCNPKSNFIYMILYTISIKALRTLNLQYVQYFTQLSIYYDIVNCEGLDQLYLQQIRHHFQTFNLQCSKPVPCIRLLTHT